MSSVALQVLQELDRGLITVDEAERLIMSTEREGRATVETSTPSAMTLPTMFGGGSSEFWM